MPLVKFILIWVNVILTAKTKARVQTPEHTTVFCWIRRVFTILTHKYWVFIKHMIVCFWIADGDFEITLKTHGQNDHNVKI